MRNIVLFLVIVILSGCSPLNYQYTTLNTAGHIDSIYGDVEIIESETQLRRKLARDFRFRLDLQRYWNSQPYGIVAQYYWSLDRGWRYGFNSPYEMWSSSNWFDYPFGYGYGYGWNHWNRWNHWNHWNGWGYSYYNSSFNNWNVGPFSNRGYNVVYNASRRGSLTSNISNRVRTNTNRKPVVVNKPTIRVNKPRINNNNTIIINNNNRPSYNNNVRPPVNNNRPSINRNSKPSINRNTTTRTSRPSPSKRGGN